MTGTPHFLVPKSFMRIGPNPPTGSKSPSPAEHSIYIIYFYVLPTFLYFIYYDLHILLLSVGWDTGKSLHVKRSAQCNVWKLIHLTKIALPWKIHWVTDLKSPREGKEQLCHQKIVSDISRGEYPKFISCSNNKIGWNVGRTKLKVWSEKYKPLGEKWKKWNDCEN